MQTITVDMTPGFRQPTIHYSQNDVGTTFAIDLRSRFGDTLPASPTVKIQATKPSGFGFSIEADSVVDSVATFTTVATMTDEAGRFLAELQIIKDAVVIYTANFYMEGEANPHPIGTTDGSQETVIPELTQLVERVEDAASSVLDMTVNATTLAAGSQATYSYDEATNTATFGIPQGEAGAGAAGVTASAYSSSKTYAVGDYVIHNSNLYRCTTAITTAEAFTAAHWTQVILGDDVTDLKSALGEITAPTRNLLNGLVVGKGIDGSGNIAEATSLWYYTDYIPAEEIVIKANGSISGYSVNVRVCEYDSNKTFLSRTSYYTNPATHTPSASCAYIRMSFYGTVDADEAVIKSFKYQVEYGSTPTSYVPPITALDRTARADVESVSDDFKHLKNSLGMNVINLFDKSAAIDGYYVGPDDGILYENENFFASDYIDVANLDSVSCSYTHIVAFYNSSKTFISGQGLNTISADSSISRPANAKYFRFSSYIEYKNNAQIGKNVSRANYVAYGKYTLPNLIDSTNTIIVDVNGNGDYTSFTEAIYENVDSGVDVLVKAGTYDIKAEYIALFGETAVNNIADSDGSTFNGFQYGVILRNRKVEFASGAHLVCDWTGHTVDGTHRFCPLRIDYNVEVIGLHLVATATFYAIHDDYGLSNDPFTVKYENCYIEGVNLHQTNCIGGGCRRYSRHILKNCYLNNNVNGNTVTARYHNTSDSNAEPEVYISNCYFNGSFTARWYGNQTTKMKVYVNNCEARSIYKMAEASNVYNVDNVILLKWCNTETNPV